MVWPVGPAMGAAEGDACHEKEGATKACVREFESESTQTFLIFPLLQRSLHHQLAVPIHVTGLVVAVLVPIVACLDRGVATRHLQPMRFRVSTRA